MPIALRSLAAALLLATALAPARAQETLLSRTGTSPSVATDGRGDFVIVWADRGNILARILPRGARQPRAPFTVNAPAAGFQINPDVAMDAAGRFAVVWQDGLDQGSLVGESFGAAGGRQSPEIPFAPAGVGSQLNPQVAMLEDGSFVAAWIENLLSGPAVKVARFSATGSPLGPEMEMKAGGESIGVQVAAFPGGFAVGWSQFYECSPGRYGELGAVARFDVEGRRTGKIYSVGTSRCASPDASALLALVGSRAGALAVFSGFQDPVQRFAPSGEPVGGRFLLPGQTCAANGACTVVAAVAMDNSGRFAVIWQMIEPGSSSLAAQLFNARGKPLTGLVPVSDEPSSDLSPPAVALADDGTLAVVWRLQGAADPQHDGLVLKRLRLPPS